jgi:hypothetical protein
MAINRSRLLSGRVPTTGYANLSASRYDFLGLSQAEPNLSYGTANSVLTLGVSNARVWANSLVLNTINCNVITSNAFIGPTGNLSVGNLLISNTTITTTLAEGNITLTSTGNQLVQVSGNTGIVIPYGNTFQRPGTPLTGTLRLNVGEEQLEVWNGFYWLVATANASNVTVSDQQISPTGTDTTYVLDRSDANQASILVNINGVGQLPGTAYTVSGNSITFAETPNTSDIIDIRYLSVAVPPGVLRNVPGNAIVYTTDEGSIQFTANAVQVATISNIGVVDISSAASLKLPSYTVAQAANIASPSTGQVIYCSNGDTGNPCLAVYSTGAWKRVALGANIST